MTQTIVIFILIAVFQAVAGYYAKKAKQKQAAADAAGRGEGSGVGISPSLDGTRPVQVNSVRPMTAEQAIAVARLIEQRNVIEAVMALRAICNIGLAEARDVINQFPARGFPADLLPPGGVSLRTTGIATTAVAPPAPPPIQDDPDHEAASQDGEEDESNDARRSLQSVRAAVDHVRAEVQSVLGRALRATGIERPSAAPAVVPRVAPSVSPAASAPKPQGGAIATPETSTIAASSARRPHDRGALADSVAGLLRSREGARRAILMSEILGPPRAVKRLR
ncbi:MAG: hypothetical protein FJ270_02610 [Planctomycetes bacterium]|nr:hypothetical protein [Planctomycetota bacterium]